MLILYNYRYFKHKFRELNPAIPLYTGAIQRHSGHFLPARLLREFVFFFLVTVVKSLTNKMGFSNLWYSHPRKYGPGSRSW